MPPGVVAVAGVPGVGPAEGLTGIATDSTCSGFPVSDEIVTVGSLPGHARIASDLQQFVIISLLFRLDRATLAAMKLSVQLN